MLNVLCFAFSCAFGSGMAFLACSFSAVEYKDAIKCFVIGISLCSYSHILDVSEVNFTIADPMLITITREIAHSCGTLPATDKEQAYAQ